MTSKSDQLFLTRAMASIVSELNPGKLEQLRERFPASAELVSAAVERLRVGRTVLLIVHRPELAARADRIVQLQEGRIVETAAAAA